MNGVLAARLAAVDKTDLDFVDLFAGPGGWDLAAVRHRLKGVGVELDDAAVATRMAAGLPTVQADVAALHPALFRARGLIASPPCQTFSLAGGGSGRRALDVVFRAVEAMAAGLPVEAIFDDPRTGLVLEPLRWALEALRGGYPFEWLAFEQVPSVLPVWEAVGGVLRAQGYSVATGFVFAERYGVPQVRKRAVLVASSSREVALPVPTHSAYHSRTPSRLDEGVAPWVSMAEALGWGATDLVGFPRRSDGRAEVEIDGIAYRARDLRQASEPAQTVTEKARSWSRFERPFPASDREIVFCPTNVRPRSTLRSADLPAPTLAFGHESPRWVIDRDAVIREVTPRVNNQSGTAFDLAWPMDRPAPTIAGREIVTMPGANANRFNGSTKSRNDGIRVTAAEAAVLQSFPADHPWQGVKTKVFEQIGNAVPPLMAEAILGAVL